MPGSFQQFYRDSANREAQSKLRTYMAFYNNTSIEIKAASLLAAKQEAIRLLNLPMSKWNKLAIVLADVPVQTASL